MRSYTKKDSSDINKSICSSILLESAGLKGHITYAILHLVTACILVFEGANDDDYARVNRAAIVYTTAAITDVGQVLKLEFLGTWNIIQMNALFNFLTFGMHMFYLWNILVKNKEYVSIKWRWLEYSVTASIMLLNIGILSGVRDVFTLCTIAGSMAITQYFGFLADECFRNDWMENIDKDSPFGFRFFGFNFKNPFWMGCIPYLFAWAPVVSSFGISTSRSEREVEPIVKAIIFIMFTFFSLFAIVQWWMIVRRTTTKTYPKSRPSPPSYNEDDSLINKQENVNLSEYDKDRIMWHYDGALHLLSFFSKLIMAWMVYGGVSGMGSR